MVDGSTFFDAQPRLPRFKAYVGIGTWTKIAINNTDFNDQGSFDAANNRFVAPVDGTCLFGATCFVRMPDAEFEAILTRAARKARSARSPKSALMATRPRSTSVICARWWTASD